MDLTRMSTSKKRSTKENVAGNAAKKAKAGSNAGTADAHWDLQVTPFLAMASKEQIEGLTKDLFTEVWKKNGAQAATDVVAPFQKKLQKDKNTNLKVAGTWNLDNDKGGTLTIDKDILTAYLENRNVDVEELNLKSKTTAETLIYRGETDRWDVPGFSAEEEFKVELKMKYDAKTDTIKGLVKVSPLSKPDYRISARYPIGGSFNFTATRGN